MDGPRHQLTRPVISLALLAIVAASSACSRSDARASSLPPRDTLHTAEESLRRFRTTLAPVESLSPVFTTREHVARSFVAAIAANDIASIAQTLLTAAEFAWLYYPDNPISRPPYELPAGIAWFELEGNSVIGVRRALATYGGRPLSFRALECGEPAVTQGTNRLWNRCEVTLELGDGTAVTMRMFGSILERGGRFKLVSAANDL